LRSEFELALGADFSLVRLHSGREAGASALALGARAYTLGSDIVFAPGHYAPETAAGRALLAHELCHVAQDGGRRVAPGDSVRIDAPGSRQEREADHVERRILEAGAGAAPPLGVSRSGSAPGPAVLHRSLLGSILGGAVGAGAGALVGAGVGALFGPVGALVGGIVGGVAGLVAGAAIGNAESLRSRRLTSGERNYLWDVYWDSVNYSQVTITRGSSLATFTATTTGNTVNLKASHFRGDTLDLSDFGFLVLAHEIGHVWQYQHGGLTYIPDSLIAQGRAGLSSGSRIGAYDWKPLVRRNVPWAEWNPEQQAQCMSDYNEALRRSRARGGRSDGSPRELIDNQTLAMAQPYVDLVRQGIGAPGSSRRRPASAPAAPSGGTP
jgi:hypothetical protein